MKDIVKNLVFVIILYVYIFNPKPLGMQSVILLYPLAIWGTFDNVGHQIFKESAWLLKCFILILIYTLFHFLIGGDSVYPKSAIVNIFNLFFVPIGIVTVFYKKGKLADFEGLINCTIIIGSLISLFLVLNPSLAIQMRLIFNPNSVYTDDFFVARREYGISEFLKFTYSILLGFFAGRFLTKNTIPYIVASLLCLCAVAFNARIGFVSFVIYMFTSLLYKGNKGKQLMYIGAFIALILLVVPFLKVMFPETYDWIFQGYLDVRGLSEHSEVEQLKSDVFFPDNLSTWVLGDGTSIYRSGDNTSDVGYVVQLFYGGLIYLTMLFFTYFKSILSIYRLNGDKFLFICLSIIMLIANFKGNAFGGNELTRFIFLYFFILLAMHKDNKRSNINS